MKFLFFKCSLLFISLNTNLFALIYFSVNTDTKTISFSGSTDVVPYQDPMMAMYYLRSGTDDSGPFTSLDLSAAFTGYPEESNPRWELWTNQSAFSIGDMSKTESYTLTATGTGVSYAGLSDIYQTQIENLVAFGTNNENSYGSPTSIPVISYSSYLLDLINRIESERDAALAERDARPTQADYDAVVTDRNSRPTQAAYNAVVAERDARLTESEVRDLRLGSSMLEVVDGDASINIELEATDNLGITNPTWTPVPESKVVIHPNFQSGKIKIDVEADDESNSGVRFFRFKMNGSNSSEDADSSSDDSSDDGGLSMFDEEGRPTIEIGDGPTVRPRP